ncbi:MAG: hypothetical protein ABSG12_13465 [Steroidobacteraceae bacterium]
MITLLDHQISSERRRYRTRVRCVHWISRAIEQPQQFGGLLRNDGSRRRPWNRRHLHRTIVDQGIELGLVIGNDQAQVIANWEPLINRNARWPIDSLFGRRKPQGYYRQKDPNCSERLRVHSKKTSKLDNLFAQLRSQTILAPSFIPPQ